MLNDGVARYPIVETGYRVEGQANAEEVDDAIEEYSRGLSDKLCFILCSKEKDKAQHGNDEMKREETYP